MAKTKVAKGEKSVRRKEAPKVREKLEPKCIHDWHHLDTHYWWDRTGSGYKWVRQDDFFCSKCLELEFKTRTKTTSQAERPMWFRMKNNTF